MIGSHNTHSGRSDHKARVVGRFDTIDEELKQKLLGKRVLVKPGDSPYTKDIPPGKIVALTLVRERRSLDFLIELDRPIFHMLFFTRYYSRCRYILFEPFSDLKQVLLFSEGRDVLEGSTADDPEKHRSTPAEHSLAGYLGFVGRRDLITEVVEGLDTRAVTYYGDARIELQ